MSLNRGKPDAKAFWRRMSSRLWIERLPFTPTGRRDTMWWIEKEDDK
jgi:hypothetical protein